MRLELNFIQPGCLDGTIRLHVPGFDRAALLWADENGPLEGWTTLAQLQPDDCGDAVFCPSGRRAAPPGVTHLAAQLSRTRDARQETLLAPLPESQRTPALAPRLRIALMSDLHLSAKPFRVRSALRRAAEYDCLLLAGDLTNDGTPEQLSLFLRCLDEEAPALPVLAVCGNHDILHRPLPVIASGMDGWYDFQRCLLDRAQALGVSCTQAACGAFSARIGGTEIFGLNAVTHWRRFCMPRGEQIQWLAEQLDAGAGRRIVLCHAPLLNHNPVRTPGEAAYLARDSQLQRVLDAAGRVIFVSGHTHVSYNEPAGCVEHDQTSGNIYINDSSAVTTVMRGESASDREWLRGALSELALSEGEIRLQARCIGSGRNIARAFWRFEEQE